ncbi:hypothetical protein BD560DRAFT_425868 [Blakeslea trispora]|nr:hypothetical protein BD560DRAFT_425868 [Blakeslea trispora]
MTVTNRLGKNLKEILKSAFDLENEIKNNKQEQNEQNTYQVDDQILVFNQTLSIQKKPKKSMFEWLGLFKVTTRLFETYMLLGWKSIIKEIHKRQETCPILEEKSLKDISLKHRILFSLTFFQKNECLVVMTNKFKSATSLKKKRVRLVFQHCFCSLRLGAKRSVEFDVVALANQLLCYVLNDTSLCRLTGEAQCFDIEKYILENEASCSSSSDGSSNSTAHERIDLLITTEDEDEIAALEFRAERSISKKRNSSSSKHTILSLEQEGKSIRINKAILSTFPKEITCNCGILFSSWSS